MDTSTVTGARRALGDQLAALRNAAGCTQADLARRTGYSRSTIGNVETGRQNVPCTFWQDADAVLAAGGELTNAYQDVESLLQEMHRRDAATIRAAHGARSVGGGSDATVGAVHRTFLGVRSSANGDGSHHARLQDRVLEAYRDRDAHAQRPSVTLVGGYAGSGKSEFARFLSSITGWAFLDKDTLTRPLAEALLVSYGSEPHDRHTQLYREHVRPLEYVTLLRTAMQNLDHRVSSVLAAPFIGEIADESWLGRLRNQCGSRGAELTVVWVDCDEQSMHDYLMFRGAERDRWKLENWADYLATVDFTLQPSCPHFVVDNRLNATVSIAEQATALASRFEYAAA